MDLNNIEELFLSLFDVEELKNRTRDSLLEYLKDEETMSEFKVDLPINTTFEMLTIDYKDIVIHLSNMVREGPIFRIRYTLSFDGVKVFWYAVEFDVNGNPIDDYFDSY